MRVDRSLKVKASPEEMWELAANTDSLNREVGLPDVKYTFESQEDGGARITAKATTMGQTLEWVEHPFEWIRPKNFWVERVFSKGPFSRMFLGTTLTPDGDGTRMDAFVEFEPRGLLGKLVGKLGVKSELGKMEATLLGFDKYLSDLSDSAYPNRVGKAQVNGESIQLARKKLAATEANQAILDHLEKHIRTGPNETVVRMRPFERADHWKTDRIETLTTFLHATRAGLLDMTWNVICPTCRGSKQEYETLKKLRKANHCNSCDIQFDAEFDRAVEVRFTVCPSIRKCDEEVYCFGGPLNTPHVIVQQRLKPGETREIEVELGRGVHILRSPQSTMPAEFVVDSEATEAAGEGEISKDGCLMTPGTLRAGTVKLKLHNPDKAERLARIEKSEWSDLAASASLVSTLQVFRDLFTTEFLAPGEELAVRSLTLLFTDLRGSTAMYDKIGDAPAYVLVRDHFRYLISHIRRNRGAVIKTMGDAIMAAFTSPEDAVRAAVEIQKDCANQPWAKKDAEVSIKIGMHMGPCIAVSSNESIDYFGTTVNFAQRVQSESQGDDLVLTDALIRRKGVKEILDGVKGASDAFDTKVRGFNDTHKFHRIVFPWTS